MGPIGAWLLKMLIQFAIQFGMAWLMKKFPWLKPEQVALIQQHVDEVKTSKKKACEGLWCPADTKGLE